MQLRGSWNAGGEIYFTISYVYLRRSLLHRSRSTLSTRQEVPLRGITIKWDAYYAYARFLWKTLINRNKMHSWNAKGFDMKVNNMYDSSIARMYTVHIYKCRISKCEKRRIFETPPVVVALKRCEFHSRQSNPLKLHLRQGKPIYIRSDQVYLFFPKSNFSLYCEK